MRRYRRLAWIGIAVAALASAGGVGAQSPRNATIEAGVHLEFGPSFLDYQNIDSAERCRVLCIEKARCRAWRYITAQAPADFGRARRTCVLGDRAVQRRTAAGGWTVSGEAK